MSCTKWKNLYHTPFLIWWISIFFSLISSCHLHRAPTLFLLLHVHILTFLLLFLVLLQLFPHLLCYLLLPITHLIHSNLYPIPSLKIIMPWLLGPSMVFLNLKPYCQTASPILHLLNLVPFLKLSLLKSSALLWTWIFKLFVLITLGP